MQSGKASAVLQILRLGTRIARKGNAMTSLTYDLHRHMLKTDVADSRESARPVTCFPWSVQTRCGSPKVMPVDRGADYDGQSEGLLKISEELFGVPQRCYGFSGGQYTLQQLLPAPAALSKRASVSKGLSPVWLHLQKNVDNEMTMSRVMGLEPSRKSRLELTSDHGPSCLAVMNTMPSPKTSEQFGISSSPDPIPGPASRQANLCCHGWRPQTDPAGGRRHLGLSTYPPVVHHTWR